MIFAIKIIILISLLSSCQSVFYTVKSSKSNRWEKKKYQNILNDKFTHYEMSPLILAVIHNKFSYIKKMVESNSNIDLNQQDIFGNTALHWAIQKKKNKIASYLLESKKQKIRVKNKNGLDIFLYSIKNGNLEMFQKIILKHSSLLNQSQDFNGKNTLFYAIQYNQDEMLGYILKNNFDISQQKDFNQNTIWHAAGKYANSKTLAILDAYPIKKDIVSTNIKNSNPLHIAVFYQNVEATRFLVKQDVNINQHSGSGDNPLILACKNGNQNIFRILIDNKADWNAKTKSEKTCLDYAIINRHNEIFTTLLQLGINWENLKENPIVLAFETGNQFVYSRLLSDEYKNKVFYKKSYGEAKLLQWAVNNNKISFLLLLLKNKANPGKLDDLGNNVMFLAVQKNKINILEILFRYNANINIQNNYGNTPLHEAAYLGLENIVIWLISKGAKLDIENEDGQTPYGLATLEEHKSIANLIKNYVENPQN